jgi:hypothetical protein
MQVLSNVAMELHKAIQYQPKLSPHFAWRLHPDDYEACVQEMRQYNEKMGYPVLQQLFILGVQVFGDESVPRVTTDAAVKPDGYTASGAKEP